MMSKTGMKYVHKEYGKRDMLKEREWKDRRVWKLNTTNPNRRNKFKKPKRKEFALA